MARQTLRFLILVLMLIPQSLLAQQINGVERAYLNRQALTSQPREHCEESSTVFPPFYASDGAGSGFAKKNFAPAGQEYAGYFPKNTVVKLNGTPNLSSLVLGSFVNVRTLSVPNPATDANARKSPPEIRNDVVGNGQPVRAGQNYSIKWGDLKSAGDLKFIVRRDAPALSIPGGDLSLAGKPIRLATIGVLPKMYRTNYCCTLNPNDNPSQGGFFAQKFNEAKELARTKLGLNPNCHHNFIFEVLNPQNPSCVSRRIEIPGANSCDAFTGTLRPIPNEQLEAISQLTNLTHRGVEQIELIDSRGLVKIPVDPVSAQGPFGSLHHWKNPRPEPLNSPSVSYDAFMNPTSACAFLRVLEEFQRECKQHNQADCQVQWNDAYHPFKINGTLSHRSHSKEGCIDVFPVGKSQRGPSSMTFTDANYHRGNTRRLVELMAAAGAERNQFFFNDPDPKMRAVGTRSMGGHDNHIHVCFPPTSEQAQKTCKEGLAGSRRPPVARPAGAASPGLFGFLAPQCQ